MPHEAQLGCPSNYSAVVFGRGGAHPKFDLEGLTELSWNRKLDAISSAQCRIAKQSAGSDCCARLGTTQPWAHELGIYRDNDLMWQGPIQTITEDKDNVSITAADVLAWMQVRINHEAVEFLNTDMDQTDIAMYYINQAFAPDDPNVRDFLIRVPTGTTTQVQNKSAYSTTWFACLDELATQDLDYTTIGRRIILGGDLSVLGPRLALTDTSFVNNVQVIMDGAQLATRYCATGQQGANASCIGDVDPFYGLVERVVSADSITTEWIAQYNARSLLNVHFPQPLVITVPSDASLTDQAPIGIDQLMCGVRIDVALTSFCRDVAQPMRLAGMGAAWDGQFETVSLTLEPWLGPSRTAALGA